MKCIIGKKIEMSQHYQNDGTVVPVTIIEAGPCVVTKKRTIDQDGYLAFQLAFGNNKRIKKSVRGQVKDLNIEPRILKEFRIKGEKQLSENVLVGSTIHVGTFDIGQKVHVTGVSKGKGFQGVVKRHGFHGSPKSHGHKDQLRMPGSIGATDPQHVFKGTRMGGRMGRDQVTVMNLVVVDIDAEKNLLFLKGAVPGSRGSLIFIQGEGDIRQE